jgi:hypothetical protein
MSQFLILPLKIPLCMMLFAWSMSALEHFTLLSSVYTFRFWVNCLRCTLAAQFNLQEKPVCWHYTQLITYPGSITVNWRIYRLKQYSSLYSWKVKLTLCLTSTTWLRCSWGKAIHTHTHTLNLPGGDKIFCPFRLALGYRVFLGDKVRPGRAADHSPPSSAAVMEE